MCTPCTPTQPLFTLPIPTHLAPADPWAANLLPPPTQLTSHSLLISASPPHHRPAGAVKITPAHDPNDFLTGKRHNLEFINVLDDTGCINGNGTGQFAGQPRFQVCGCCLGCAALRCAPAAMAARSLCGHACTAACCLLPCHLPPALLPPAFLAVCCLRLGDDNP